MVKVGIIGATGYAGGEIARLLLQRDDVEIKWYGSQSHIDRRYSQVFGNMFHFAGETCRADDMEKMAEEVDVIFMATPQGYCASVISEAILSQTKVIDLSADFRLKDVSAYEMWYEMRHSNPTLIEEAVYGLCERNREAVRSARLLANPGCYPTCSILSVYPLVREGMIDPGSLIIDAKSGTSGAGRGVKRNNLFCEVNENMKAYGICTHRHTPEIEEQLSYVAKEEVRLNFTPHLVPMMRGILVTAYANLKQPYTYEEIREVYDHCYENEYFVRVLEPDMPPETRWVEGSNFVDVNFSLDKRTGRIIMMGAMDNLIKGAAGQAVQNMNLMFGLEENKGLKQIPMFP